MVGDNGSKCKGGSKNFKNIRPDGLAKIIASLMMENFKKGKKQINKKVLLVDRASCSSIAIACGMMHLSVL